ncbi:unnamed protein product [Penicillium nalgiovense]|uniref:Gfd2/YDR514C-like C-terminal domain-containing protein n=1 Tax=Penicillium nalgiovense TaxID=60175 RepID=A0A1V6Z6I9_PENNA|nr:hypothetical protein PENNAL_c0002G07699 [Penicillium nalgiovense]CAG7956984.1 unnamed protein product [Penicillium nalgiovense]CAG8011018.1 unnamed protein product [Penicillium nalgiovense]CAG8046071.1 unnamed protein product [Penicillium nalgiovense]CAG8057903.1 unnamed protein product [Penicillium nalgiovense]
MDARERLKMLLEGDEGLKDLNTHLYQAEAVQPAPGADGADAVAEPKAKQGVSGYALPVDFKPEEGMEYPEGEFPLSYIRTHVVGELSESEDKLLTLRQNRRPQRRTPKMHLDLSGLPKYDRGDGPDIDSDEELVTAIPVSKSFTPAVTMARYPFKYLHGDDAKRVNERFYEGDKFWNRTWDLYYLSVPRVVSNTPFLLIPTFQAQALLDEINSALSINLTLTGVGKEGLVIDVGNEQLPRPVYLGRSSTRDRKVKLESKVPRPPENWGCWAQLAEPRLVEDFQKKVKQSLATIKTKKNNKQAARDARTKKWQECLGRVQAYFGLRPALQLNVTQPSFANGQIEAIDALKPVKWAFQDGPIFISVDVEWMDRYGIMTEVGISTLDMLDLQGVVPGDYGHMWMKQIRTRHLRVKEYRNWVNETYTIGCPGSFRFGKSEIIPSAGIGDVVDAAFRPPYTVPSKEEMIAPYKNQKRTVILVGLDLHGDIAHLQRAGSQVFVSLNESYSVVRETIDVAELYRVNYEENQTRGLQALLGLLNILSPDLHNAGNDAHYTLQALVRLMLRVAGEKPWGYESAEVNDKEYVQPDDDRKDKPNITVEPQEQRKERIARAHARLMAMCEQEDDNTKEDPVWSH